MADLVITAANVKPGSNARTTQGVAGATITAGQLLYLEAATKKYKLADSDSATAEVRNATAIALCGAADGQPIVVQTAGDVTIGATLTAGATYFASNTAGGICPDADVGVGEYVVLVGVAKSTTVLALNFVNSGVSR